MSQHATSILLCCKRTVLAEKKEIVWGGIKTTTAHPTFQINVEFGEPKGKSSSVCPHCGRGVSYQAYRFEFSLRKALKWPGALIAVSILFFLSALFLVAFGGWDMDPAMWYFGMWGIIGFFFGVGLLIFQVLRYLTFYTTNKFKYVFAITGWRSEHFMMDHRRGASWRQPPS